MKPTPGQTAVLVLVGAAACGAALLSLGSTPASPPAVRTPSAAPGASETERARLAALEERVASLVQEVEHLGGALEAQRASARVPLGRSEPPRAAPVVPGQSDPSWFLARYVESFRDGGPGSEYFRLAVSAYAPDLVEPIVGLVADHGSSPTLRVRLTEILGDVRLRQQARVVRTLVGLLSTADGAELAAAAVHALSFVSDAAGAAELERRVWMVRYEEARWSLVTLVLRLAGSEANAVLARLLATAPDPGAEQILIALVGPSDPAGALACFRIVSTRAKETRLAGARRIHAFRAPPITAFVDEWAAREADEDVREALHAAKQALGHVPSWAPEQAIGPPDVVDVLADSPEAWASRKADGGSEWLQLEYDPPQRARGLRIHEVLASGAVARVTLIDAGGGTHAVWEGVDPTLPAGVFELEFPLTAYEVRSVRLELDTARRSGWNEIDAVGLVGPGGVAWAKAASASSFYGGGGEGGELELLDFGR